MQVCPLSALCLHSKSMLCELPARQSAVNLQLLPSACFTSVLPVHQLNALMSALS